MVFYLLLLIDFYIVPWFIKDTGSAMIVMLVIIPLICLITSVFYGIRNGFDFWYILSAYSARTAHPFQRNGAPFRFKLSKAQQVD